MTWCQESAPEEHSHNLEYTRIEDPRFAAARAGVGGIAFFDSDGGLTYCSFVRALEGSAACLQRRGLAPGDAVSLFLDCGIALYGTRRAGGIAARVNDCLWPRQEARSLDCRGGCFLVTGPCKRADLDSNVLSEAVALDAAEESWSTGGEHPRRAAGKDERAAILYTSVLEGELG